jgi:hypothetical protein
MKTAMALGLSAAMFILVGCGGAEEKTASNSDQLSAGCFSSIEAPPGSAAWRAELDACLADADDVPGGGEPADPDDGEGFPGQPGEPGDDGAGAGGGGCVSGISCTNGSCTCSAGANKGAACDGTKATGADSCSVLCNSCS